jgi:hypothetical protein
MPPPPRDRTGRPGYGSRPGRIRRAPALTLVAFARGDDFVAYAQGVNIILD